MDSKHNYFIRETITLAILAREKGDHPFGALLVEDDEVILTAVNSVISSQDVTHHAELNLISAASRMFSWAQLGKMILYTSTEPCAMCAGAIFWAGVRSVVYGCSAERLGTIAGGGLVIPSRHLFGYGDVHTAVIGPILEDEAAQVHDQFWS